MSRLETVVVVGASLAGLRAVEALRSRGYAGRLVWIGAESHLPYDRPPLSKEVLRGDWGPERTALRKDGSYGDLALDLRLGRAAESLDLREREVVLREGDRIGFDGLVIATGASPRTLPGTPPLAGIHVLRSLDDSLAIHAALGASPRVAVVGAGFIGSEVAASCRSLGLDVTLIEALASPLARVLDPRMGALCAALHRDQGVDLRLERSVERFEGSDRVERLVLNDGSRIDADLVVVGIGVLPETGWLAASGLALGDGVLCDATLATAAPGVVAAGDVARWHHPGYGERIRIEHWTNAVEQGGAAAQRLLAGEGSCEPYAPVPFVWSDQYDAKIQVAGLVRPDDDTRIVYGSLEERRFVALYGREGRLVGALGFNRPRQLMAVRRWMRENISFEEAVARTRS
jgi:NADPH-dependent 2,4-dienoyl-CoA reductase/sulfur reductase-like enzyme